MATGKKKQKGAGRPWTHPRGSIYVTSQVSPEAFAAIQQVQAARFWSRSVVMREIVNEWLELRAKGATRVA